MSVMTRGSPDFLFLFFLKKENEGAFTFGSLLGNKNLNQIQFLLNWD